MLDLSRLPSLGEALRDALVTYKSNVALIEADRHRETLRLSYAELRAHAERLSCVLADHGVVPGDRCAVLLPNQARWTVSAFAMFWAGAVIVPLDYKLSAQEQLALLAHARPKLLVTEVGILRALRDADRAAVLAAITVVVTDAPQDAPPQDAVCFEARSAREFRPRPRARSDLACIVYSSGTGGTPKGCMLTHDAYLEQAQVLGRMVAMRESDLYFSILPTNHALDFMCSVIVALLSGAAVVYQRTLRPEYLAETMRRYRVTHTALVPRILKSLRERIDERLGALSPLQRTLVDGLATLNDLATLREAKPELSRRLLAPIHERFGGRLRTIFAGGAYVDPELAEYFYRLGLPVLIGYGLTEACTVLTLNDGKPFRPDTVGRPVAGVELQIRDPDDDGVGEVCVRSRTLMQGYLNEPELTREVLVDGFLRTGDLGSIDASGHLKLRGRRKDMIVTAGGKNVYPEDVEVAFGAVPCEELCVFAEGFLWPERQRLGQESLVVVLRPKKDAPVAEALASLARCNRTLASFRRVAQVVVCEAEFPRTASMKVKRAALAAQVRAAELPARPLGEQ